VTTASVLWIVALVIVGYIILDGISRLTLRDVICLAALAAGLIVLGSLFYTGNTDAGVDLLTRVWDSLKAAVSSFGDEFEKGARGR
jgi:Na+/proline symporter